MNPIPCTALAKALATAAAGAYLQLSGACGYTTVGNLKLPDVVIDARHATFTRLDFYNVSGFDLIGFHSLPSGSQSLMIRKSRNFHLFGTECDGSDLACAQISESSNWTSDLMFSDKSKCDTLDIGPGTTDFVITRTVGVRNVSTPCHPDVIQLGGAAGNPIKNGVIRLTVGVGRTMGIDTFDHQDYGDSDLTISDNVLVQTNKWEISQYNVHNAKIFDNLFFPYPGGAGGQAVNVTGGAGNTATTRSAAP